MSEPRNNRSREPTLYVERKATTTAALSQAAVVPSGSRSGARAQGSPRNLGGPVISACQYRKDARRISPGSRNSGLRALGSENAERVVSASEGNEVIREG